MAEREEDREAGESGGRGGALILIADDDEDILELVCFRLEQAGYETTRARDGEEALRLVRERRPDLCVLDVMMPRLNGFEVLQALRKEPDTDRIPVVLLTATVQERDIARGFEVGADDYIRKPFRAEELQARVAVLLERG
jgi:DNA-binding response OmpR family regulator